MEHHERPGEGKYLSLTSYRRDGTPVAILPDSEGQHVDTLMKRKYRIDRILVLPLYRAVIRVRHRQQPEGKPAYLAITPLG